MARIALSAHCVLLCVMLSRPGSGDVIPEQRMRRNDVPGRGKDERPGMRLILNERALDLMAAEGEYLNSFKSPSFESASGRTRRTAEDEMRPGSPTTTHSCDRVREVPAEIRTPDVMRPDGLTNFYQKYTEAYGIPILGSSNVPNSALKRACYVVRFMLADHKYVRQAMYKLSGRVAIMADTEVTTDIPEHSNMDPYWDTRARGLGGTVSLPLTTGAEENVLCYSQDSYWNEDILLHEFAHAVDLIGLSIVRNGWYNQISQAYEAAKAAGLWSGHYAMTNKAEYFAEGVQSFFNVNAGSIKTRTELQNYDPTLYTIIQSVFPCNNNYIKRCDATRAQEQNQVLTMDCANDGSSFPVYYPGCSDDSVDCLGWAASGECQANPAYMNYYCKSSCSVC